MEIVEQLSGRSRRRCRVQQVLERVSRDTTGEIVGVAVTAKPGAKPLVAPKVGLEEVLTVRHILTNGTSCPHSVVDKGLAEVVDERLADELVEHERARALPCAASWVLFVKRSSALDVRVSVTTDKQVPGSLRVRDELPPGRVLAVTILLARTLGSKQC